MNSLRTYGERSEPSSARPSVLCVVNRPGWAHDRKTDSLAVALADRYRIVKRFQSEVTKEEIESADLVLVYFWLQVEALGDLAAVLWRCRERLLLGACGHSELTGGWREPGLALLRQLPAAVFANNCALVRELEPLLGRPVFYTPNGVDTQFFRPTDVPRRWDRLRVGWAGSLSNHGTDLRGVHDVIAPAVAAVSGAELSLAAREERWRDRDEMLEYYHSLDVYVCASRSEGTPNPCLEAAACGLPVVTTRVGNMPELIRDGENGLFVEREAGDVAARLRQLRDDPALRARLGAAARVSVEAWDWRHLARNYDALFRHVLETRAGRSAAS